MFRLGADLKVYLHREPIDFRAGINSLAVLVQGKRYFPRTLTPALSTGGLRIGNGIWSDQAAVASAKLKGSRSSISASSAC